MGVELVLNVLGQYHTDLLSAAWYYNTFLLSAGLGTTQSFYQLGLVLKSLPIPHSHIINWT